MVERLWRIARRWPLVPLAVAALLMAHTGLLAWSAYVHSPVTSEVGHLPAGISHWQFGRFDLYRVNPPLVRMVAALPVIAARPETAWQSYRTDPLVRSEALVGIDFVNANGFRTFWLYTLGRWACIPFSWIGACVCYRWAREMYGAPSGLMAMTLWCFCPNILGNGALVMPDMPAAALGVAACYAFWHWLKHPQWTRALTAGVLLGLAELAKTTLIIFYLLWPLLWIAYRLHERQTVLSRTFLRELGMLLAQLVMSVYVVNVGYGFEGSLQRLGDYRFQSRALTEARNETKYAPGNRFANSWLTDVLVPLPKNYAQGIDTQKVDFENGMRSYLGGEWSDRGWWYFYLYGLAIKVPLGMWVIAILAIIASVKFGISRDEILVLFPAAVILALVSSQSGFSIHFRYVLPMFPFLFILVSKAALLCRRGLVARALTCGALLWSTGGSLYYFPHSLSYFNELVGGPAHGHEYMLDSSIAWGQDLLFLKEWYDAHPEARPLFVAITGFVSPLAAGIDSDALPDKSNQPRLPNVTFVRPPAGWYAIDVNYLQGSVLPVTSDNARRMCSLPHGYDLTYFLRPQAFGKVWRINLALLCATRAGVNRAIRLTRLLNRVEDLTSEVHPL